MVETMVNKAQEEQFTTIYKATFNQLSKHVFFKVPQLPDAEDIIQNVYADYYRYVILKNRKPENALAYLIQMADHEIGRFYSNRKIILDLSDDETDGMESIADENDLEQEVFDKIGREDLWVLVKQLKPYETQVLIAHFRFDMTFREIAENLKQNESTVKLRYYRALRKLKQLYLESICESGKESE
jgi:RNA polymerase sigma-70 factor (ECF subfamily)